MLSLQGNYESIQKEIRSFHSASKLLAVTKGRSIDSIRALFALGQRDFAESYYQELAEKQSALVDLQVCWHFIGRLQSNKCAAIARSCDWVHSLSSSKHARLLSEARPKELPPLSVCVQVNVSGEQSKSGLNREELLDFAQELCALSGVSLKGVMTMLPKDSDIQTRKEGFQRCADWARLIAPCLDGQPLELSMGMSQDYHEALLCGATWCRIGSALFR